MITAERVVTYIRSLETEECPMLEEIEREALEEGVPIIRKETQSFLKILISLQRPEKVLEIGTGAGFSALLMCEYAPEDCRFVTIENYEKRILAARENFRRAGREQQITLMEGDALEVLKRLEGKFDFVFMDAAKAQYIHSAGGAPAPGGRRSSGVGQRAAGRGCVRVPVCGGTAGPDDPCPDAGIPV